MGGGGCDDGREECIHGVVSAETERCYMYI